MPLHPLMEKFMTYAFHHFIVSIYRLQELNSQYDLKMHKHISEVLNVNIKIHISANPGMMYILERCFFEGSCIRHCDRFSFSSSSSSLAASSHSLKFIELHPLRGQHARTIFVNLQRVLCFEIRHEYVSKRRYQHSEGFIKISLNFNGYCLLLVNLSPSGTFFLTVSPLN